MVIYDYFEPATQAGGPTLSCINLVRFLEPMADLWVLTGWRDLDGTPLPVQRDRWLPWGARSQVCYAHKGWSMLGVWRILRQLQPDVLYLNGVFSPLGTLLPLFLQRWLLPECRVILAPRGMLQSQALAVKALKKRLYLQGLLLPLLRRRALTVQATGPAEWADMQRLLPVADPSALVLLGNLPRMGIACRVGYRPAATRSLVTVALISPMKNILTVLQALAQVQQPMHYHLYGPVKDAPYWQHCLQAAQKLPAHVGFTYHGLCPPAEVPARLAAYDVYVQPSRSENFGHALFEALMVGLPLVTSYTTPWQQLQHKQAGWNVAGEDVAGLAAILDEAAQLKPERYAVMAGHARQLAENYLQQSGLEQGYRQLFQVTMGNAQL
ncbi:glycosyltransferase family 4 protein [Magnetococcus marinus]|uniref:glycosyltransferase family 4 protein n=1 Tax=Magnetococcus marinus TaxID=1124597 RepID=UPI00031E79E7|nr:glycosyltransferase [Magnetococcus marinus]